MHNKFWYTEPFKRVSPVWQTDGQTALWQGQSSGHKMGTEITETGMQWWQIRYRQGRATVCLQCSNVNVLQHRSVPFINFLLVPLNNPKITSNPDLWHLLANFSKLTIRRSEIVTPLWHAMSLVNRYQIYTCSISAKDIYYQQHPSDCAQTIMA